MKKNITLIFILNVMNCFSQDLVISEFYSENPNGFTSYIGKELKVSYKLKNQGTNSTSNCKMKFFISQSLSSTGLIQIGEVSVPGLSMNQTTTISDFYYNIPDYLYSGLYYIYVKIDSESEVFETNESNNFVVYSSMPINHNNIKVSDRRLPYPMIFIHGLNSSSSMWDELASSFAVNHGLQFGGQFNFCLNSDQNNSFASLNDVVDFTNYSSITNGDFYFINFDVDANGNVGDNGDLSNQAAIVKQGYALKIMIDSILNVANVEKVHLIGHSMGGLCSREYIQNYDLNAQKVGKLSTIFTPHGGSNATGLGFEMFVGLDELSDAVRDLRYSVANDYPGVYLFGGLENNDLLTNTFFDFDNVDVNCNGVIEENVIGLNFKNYPDFNKMSYSSVIGYGSLLGGDAVVDEYRANVNNYLPNINADTFMIESPEYYGMTEVLHSNGLQDPNLFDTYIYSFDEPDYRHLAFIINSNHKYKGRIDRKSLGDPYVVNGDFNDYDYFKFVINENSDLSIDISNININDLTLYLYDHNGVLLNNKNNLGQSNINLTEDNLISGEYFILIKGIAEDGSYNSPYVINLVSNIINDAELNNNLLKNNFRLYPNPSSEYMFISGLTFENEKEVKIFTIEGKLISIESSNEFEKGLNISKLSKGMYYLLIDNNILHFEKL